MKKTADIVIMGSGLAGITAAEAALNQGKRVIVFEKRPFQGGSVSNCPIAVFILKNDPAYKDAAFRVIYEYGNYTADPSLIRTYVNNCWRIKDYLNKLNISMMPLAEVPLEGIGDKKYMMGFPAAISGHADSYMLGGRGKGHAGALICLNAMRDITARGGEYFLNTPVTEILTDDGGNVSGVTAKNNDTGEIVEVDCKAVIIASGGIMDDQKMLKEHTGFTYTDGNCSNGGNVLFNCFPNSKQTGDGQKLAWGLGGARGKISVTGHNLVPGPGIVASSPWIAFDENRVIQEQPYLWVNKNGDRFFDESLSNNHMAISCAIYNQPGRESYLVFDEDTRNHLEQDGVDYMYLIFPVKKVTDLPGQFKRLREECRNQHVFVADTLDELCAQAGINRGGLEKTLTRYNGYCDKGVDEEYAKPAHFLHPVRRGPFYSLRVFCAGYNTIGGIKTNGRMEVIRDDGKAIPGLYAAGDIMLGEFWGLGGCSGANTTMAFGFAAGDSAAAYADEH